MRDNATGNCELSEHIGPKNWVTLQLIHELAYQDGVGPNLKVVNA
jgi:hypothetical protein